MRGWSRTRGRSRQLRRSRSPRRLGAACSPSRGDRPGNGGPGARGGRGRARAGRQPGARPPRGRLHGHLRAALHPRAGRPCRARQLQRPHRAWPDRRAARVRGVRARAAASVRGRTRRRVSPDERRAVAYGAIVTAGLVAIDIALGEKTAISGSYALGAIVAGVLAGFRAALIMAVGVLVLAVASGLWNTDVGEAGYWARLFVAFAGALLAL